MAAKNFQGLQFSLREMLVLVAIIALGITTLTSGGVASYVLGCTAILLAMSSLVIVLVDRGRNQAFAIGVISCGLLYVGMIKFTSDNTNNNPFYGQLPTSKFNRLLHEQLLSKRVYFNPKTGLYDLDFSQLKLDGKESSRMVTPEELSAFAPVPSNLAPSYTSLLVQTRDYKNYTTEAHILWGLLFGYLGGKFAVWVYLWRHERENPNPPQRSR